MKILFVINPISGGKEKRNWEETIREYFSKSEHSMDFYLLTGKDDAASVQHHIRSFKPRRVVGVGGDGTIKLLAEVLQDTSIPLGILPAGSANGMARELGIPLDIIPALDICLHGHPTKIDLIEINKQEICMHLSDLGMNAMLVKHFEQYQKRGMWGYARSVINMLYKKRKRHYTISTDSGVYRRQAYMVALANARKYGTGATINPLGNVADGVFEVVVVRKLHLLEILKGIFTERSFHPARIEVLPTKALQLSVSKATYFQVDGEYRGKMKSLQARILPGALEVMMPEDQ
jgi:diacylglycerol kinase (ATP)